MPKYEVTFYYHSHAVVKIEAEDKDTAVHRAREMVNSAELRKNLQEVDYSAILEEE